MHLHFDLETSDPDDLFALCIVATHPRVTLVGVTVYPGGRDQVGLVKTILRRLGLAEVPVGANVKLDGKQRVGPFYTSWLGRIEPMDPDGSATEVLQSSASLTTLGTPVNLLTGAPLTNVWESGVRFPVWTCQGGFAGDDVVPPSLRLEKFEGKVTCPTFNLNGNPKAALGLLLGDRMGHIRMVSKNVCHGYWFGKTETDNLPRNGHAGLRLLCKGMYAYLEKHPDGKALHDVLAALLAIDPTPGTWITGRPYRERGEWGFRPEPDSNTMILVGVDALINTVLAE